MECKECKNFEEKPKKPSKDDRIAFLEFQLTAARRTLLSYKMSEWKTSLVERTKWCENCHYKDGSERRMLLNEEPGTGWILLFIAVCASVAFNIYQLIFWVISVWPNK